jgi:extradiol dioxygenase family protein
MMNSIDDWSSAQVRFGTCDGRDAHAAVALDEHVHGVLEHVRPQQQRRDVVEHDPCTRAHRPPAAENKL